MDKKTVIGWLEELADVDWRNFHSDSEVSNIARSTLELIYEQDLHLQHLLEITEKFEKELNKQPEIVRCKDCKYYTNVDGYMYCIKMHEYPYFEWFCADGERKENA